ncbi:MAG TPA: glycosyltransferase family 39 protein [Pyrinomonadaceae bacterium]|nr:glycosyltransferase family 39 protein [Pyrinomonadaceae bacterium]
MRSESERESPARNFWREWRWWLGSALVALLLALLFADPFIGDWDALDYTLISIEGRPSSMALGRSLFIYANHGVWNIAHTLFGLKAEHAYLLFKYMVVAQSPLAAVACWALAREVTGSRPASTAAALLVVTSPFFVVYGGQVMTEIPSLWLTALALLVYLRGVRARSLWRMLLGAAILGAGVNVRETVAFYAPWLVAAPIACGWKLGRREIARVAAACCVFAVAALGPFAYWFLSDESYRAAWYGWREAMRVEQARHPLTARNLLAALVFFFLAAPLVATSLAVAALKEWRARKFSALPALAATGFCATLLLLLNYSTAVNWRYFLTGLPALAPLAAHYFMREQTARFKTPRRAFVSTIAGISLVAVVLGLVLKPSLDKSTAQHAAMKEYRARLAFVPRDAVVLSGTQSIAVIYWRGVGAGWWEVIGAGSGWPAGRLVEVVEKNLDENRRVVLDAEPRFWPPCGWQESETREVAGLFGRFRFRRLADTLYEVRPLADETAGDEPDLKGLLPENRAAEVARCRGQAKLS